MMNRRNMTWAIAGLLLLLLWDFADRALYYSPLSMYMSGQTASPEPSTTEPLDSRSAQKGSWSTAIVERNLFSQTRSLTAPLEANEKTSVSGPGGNQGLETQEEVRPNVILSGIIKNQLGEHVAFLTFESESPIGVREGETIKGVKVLEIDNRRVLLKWKASEFELTPNVSPLITR